MQVLKWFAGTSDELNTHIIQFFVNFLTKKKVIVRK
jgi:hypothetical protein